MNYYYPTCPYCGTQLRINELSAEKSASKCPHCHNTVLITEYGRVLKKPNVYKCLTCNEEHIYDGRPPMVLCDKCGSFFLTSEYGNCLISHELYRKGEQGELTYKKKRDKVTERRNKWRKLSKKVKACIYSTAALLIAACVGIYIYSLPENIEKSIAFANRKSVWKEFRSKNPYNIQIEGIKDYDDGSYLMLLSEPNEDVKLEDLHSCFDKYNCSIETDSIKIGYDGWLRDAIVCFNDIKPDMLPELYSKLYTTLYGTDYKANPIDLSVIPNHVAFSTENLNLQVTEEELRSWLLDEAEPLVSIDNNSRVTNLSSIFNSKFNDSKLYISKDPGFVIWVFEQGSCDRNNFRINARKFALDSDLILGSISKGSKVAIIARERCIPTYELPPMREETLRILAGTEEGELAQSYERTSLFAGKQPGGKDFAPIYLSDELWHTEYGNILNITDQMLKSWSENGLIDYIGFNYPKPVNWAFNSGVMHDLGVSQLTYNWNTAGVGYIVEDDEDDGYCIFAVNRTGSLPVSYIPGESEGISDNDPVYLAEEQAYDFFSNLNSPELVKVVQYLTMYQIFHNFDISTEPVNSYLYADEVFTYPEKLKDGANSLIGKLASFSLDTQKKMAKHYKMQVLNENEYKQKSAQDRYFIGHDIGEGNFACGNIEEEDGLWNYLACLDFFEKMQRIHNTLEPLKDDETLMDCIGAFILDRNGTDISYSTSSKTAYEMIVSSPFGNYNRDYEECIGNALEVLQSNGFELQEFNEAVGNIDIVKAKKLYLKENESKHRGWMKCPTLVESWSLTDSATQVGGHNLNSKVTRFKVSKDVPIGKTRKANGVIEINARDRMTKVSDPSYLRKVGRLGNSELGQVAVSIRPKTLALERVTRRSGRGFNRKDHLTVELNEHTGHTINGKKYTDLTDFLDDVGKHMAEGEAQFKEIQIKGLGDAGVDVEVFLDGVKGRMRKGSCANIPYDKYDFSSPSVRYDGDIAYVTIPIKAGKIEFGSTSMVSEAGMGGLSKKSPQFINTKGGKVEFSMPKSRVQQFMNMIKEFLSKQKGNWNDFKIRMEMKRRGIPPTEIKNEGQSLKVAKNSKIKQNGFIQFIS